MADEMTVFITTLFGSCMVSSNFKGAPAFTKSEQIKMIRVPATIKDLFSVPYDLLTY